MAFLLGLSLLVISCSDNVQETIEPMPQTIKEPKAEPPDTLDKTQPQRPLPKVCDTLMHQSYVFVSQPVPIDIRRRMLGKSLPDTTKISFTQLRYLTLPYYDFDGNIQIGEMVCNKAIADDLLHIFRTLFSEAYPICSIRLVDDFEASDEASMEANNTSCFNYRYVEGTRRLSRHAFGKAVDINPLQNPFVRGSRIRPVTATDFVDRSKDFPHKIDKDDLCKKVFTSYGFRWGGNWYRMKDWQHFEK